MEILFSKKSQAIVFFAAVCCGVHFSPGYAQDLSDVSKLCNNLTPSNKAIAQRAGYDLDELCFEANSILSKNQKAVPAQKKVPRQTISNALPAGNVEKSPGVPKTTALDSKKKSVKVSLKPFGYDLFANAPTTFAPSESLLAFSMRLARSP